MYPKEWREPTDWEARLLQKLLSADFPGHEIFATQAKSARVREVDEEEQLEFQIAKGAPTVQGDYAGPCAVVEGHYMDLDGRDVALMIHVDRGKLRLLEKYKSWITPVELKTPDLDSISVNLL